MVFEKSKSPHISTPKMLSYTRNVCGSTASVEVVCQTFTFRNQCLFPICTLGSSSLDTRTLWVEERSRSPKRLSLQCLLALRVHQKKPIVLLRLPQHIKWCRDQMGRSAWRRSWLSKFLGTLHSRLRRASWNKTVDHLEWVVTVHNRFKVCWLLETSIPSRETDSFSKFC